jgi:site-specific DNA-methyltransferase (adenine-specific)
MCAIEDAGWGIRDCLGWLYGSGFPKSLNLKGEWQGWGTALKPAWEPIVLARKPLRGTVAQNVLEHGTGALNIDGCRVGTKEVLGRTNNGRERYNPSSYTVASPERTTFDRSDVAGGRFPANLIHDGSDEVLAVFPETKSGKLLPGHGSGNSFGVGNHDKKPNKISGNYGGDSGSASRFFYCAKASSSERGEGNNHPTVKPQALMQYLCRLVTPPGGVVLDPFTGSGSTLLAALKEGFRFIGIELEEKYCEIARRRVAEATPSLFREAVTV